MRTAVCEMLGIEFPILAFSHCRDVVAAVSRAGGLGVLGAVGLTPGALETELEWIESEVGDRPYGVDIIVPNSYVGRERGGLDFAGLNALIPDEHRRFVDSLMEEYKVPAIPADEPHATGMLSWSSEAAARSLLDTALDHPIKLVANALGPPPPEMIAAAHDRGVVVAALAGKADHARRHKDAGVDLIVAQGYEAGGHTGEVATMVLVPEVVDAVAPTPVLAAGGIASGRQMAAAMALGAQGVWTGSVWLTTEEAETHPVVKDKFLRASSSDTVRSRSVTGKPARQLRTAWTEEWDRPDHPDPLPMPLQTMLVAEAQQRISRSAFSADSGARDLITYFVGQVVGSLDRVKTARQVVLDMVKEYVEVVSSLAEEMTAVEG
jgi:NAD(P)H-dependent flavin oxidoreductase YrpB (nitropropane dioxygenase family)